jgi:hypothetical protein
MRIAAYIGSFYPGECYRKHRQIGETLGMSRRTVIRKIEKLCDAGYLARRRYSDEEGLRGGAYRLVFPVPPSKTEANSGSKAGVPRRVGTPPSGPGVPHTVGTSVPDPVCQLEVAGVPNSRADVPRTPVTTKKKSTLESSTLESSTLFRHRHADAEKDALSDPTDDAVQEAVDAYNAIAGRGNDWQQQASRIKPQTYRLIAEVLNNEEHGGLSGWRAMLKRASASDWLAGRQPRPDSYEHFRVTVAYLAKEYLPIIEGRHDNVIQGDAVAVAQPSSADGVTIPYRTRRRGWPKNASGNVQGWRETVSQLALRLTKGNGKSERAMRERVILWRDQICTQRSQMSESDAYHFLQGWMSNGERKRVRDLESAVDRDVKRLIAGHKQAERAR